MAIPKFDKFAGLLVVAVFAVLYVPRLWSMGLYSDDWFMFLWPDPFDPAYLWRLVEILKNRPGVIPVYWIGEVVTNWSPARAQGFAMALSLGAALSLGLLACTLTTVLGGPTTARRVAFWLAAALFLVFPWNLGLTGWITSSIGLVSVFWFALAMRFLLLPGERILLSLLVGGLLLVVSFLSYEVLYGQASLLVVLAWLVTPNLQNRRVLAWSFAVTVVANAAAIAFNRLSDATIRKTFDPDFWQIFVQSYGRFLDIVSQSFIGQYGTVLGLAGLASAIGLVALALAHGIRRALWCAVFALGGTVLGGILFSAAGYGIIALGYQSRTLFPFSFHAALFLAIGFGAAAASDKRILRLIGPATAMGLIAVLGLATADRMRDWQATWTDQLAILNSLPNVPDDVLDPSVAVAYIGPGPERPVWLATAQEVSGALSFAAYLQAPSTERRHRVMGWKFERGNLHWMSAGPTFSVDWTGDKLTERVCANGDILGSRSTTKVYIWQIGDPSFLRAEHPFHVGCV